MLECSGVFHVEMVKCPLVCWSAMGEQPEKAPCKYACMVEYTEYIFMYTRTAFEKNILNKE